MSGSTYCDVRTGHDLTLAAPSATYHTGPTLPVFLPPSIANISKTTWLREHCDSVRRFSATLITCAGALGVPKECLHLFFEKGTTSAFNAEGSLFFNLRMWEEMRNAVNAGKAEEGEGERYWFVVLCHEVAHNLDKGHGPEHGFWT